MLPLPGQAIFLPALPSSSLGAATEPGLLDGTKGPQSISPGCAAERVPPPQPCSASRPFCHTQHKTPISQCQLKYQLSLAWQQHHPDLCSAHAPLSPPWSILCASQGLCHPDVPLLSPPGDRTGNEEAEGCEHCHFQPCQKDFAE